MQAHRKAHRKDVNVVLKAIIPPRLTLLVAYTTCFVLLAHTRPPLALSGTAANGPTNASSTRHALVRTPKSTSSANAKNRKTENATSLRIQYLVHTFFFSSKLPRVRPLIDVTDLQTDRRTPDTCSSSRHATPLAHLAGGQTHSVGLQLYS